MKDFLQIIHKPKIVIPSSIVLAATIGILSYGSVGKAPIISLPETTALSTTTSSNTESINLSFLEGGRVGTIRIHNGDHITAGDVLATLDASGQLGTLNQAKGALELAQAQYGSLNVQYANTKKEQDVLVQNAYRVLLSSNLSAVASSRTDSSILKVDDKQMPQISGTYTCDQTGSYEIYPYASEANSGYSFNVKGLEESTGTVTVYTPQAIGSCGLFILFPVGYIFDPSIKWVIDIPNTRSTTYAANKNAYDLAVATRDQVLKQLETNLGNDGSTGPGVAQATIDAAEGAYQSALANYNNTIITAPISGTVSFIDKDLKIGENIVPNKTVITITR